MKHCMNYWGLKQINNFLPGIYMDRELEDMDYWWNFKGI